jgi:hypothetical protein
MDGLLRRPVCVVSEVLGGLARIISWVCRNAPEPKTAVPKPSQKKITELSPCRAPALQSLVRALRLLRAVYRSPEGRGLAELCREHGLHKTTGLRLLRSLVAVDVVARDKTSGLYRASPTFWVRMAPFPQARARHGIR